MFAVLAFLSPFAVSAQFFLSGKINDSSTQQSLAGASVRLNNSFLVVQSDASGTYSFPNLKSGKYILTVSYLGFKTQQKAVDISVNSTVNISLDRSSLLADEVIVSATRATNKSATTYRNLDKAELEKNNLGQDLPYLLNQTPSVVVTSDAGAGVGYTGIRIRGSDATRVNLTINGIPLNDSESQGTFLVNLPDFASSIDNIQLQRGVGTSTNGAGAFGASINVQTITRRDSAYAEVNNTFGSYNTIKNTVNVGTGLINGKFSFDGRLSRIQSDGFIDRAASKLKSYFLSGAFYGKNDLLRVNVFSGNEKTFQVWNGVPEAKLNGNTDSLFRHYYDNIGSLYFNTADSLNLFNADPRKYSQFLYPDQTDNYTQDHYQALYSHSFSSKLSANAALHYTYGRGYYEEFKSSQKLSNYGLQPDVVGSTTITRSDLIRRRWLDNDFYGTTFSLNYVPDNALNFTFGGAYNQYDGRHFGEVIWAKYASNGNIYDRYYEGVGAKKDFNMYGKAVWQIGQLSLMGDLQYRKINYSINGTDKNRMPLNHSAKFDFFNPKVGLSYQLNDESSAYASFAVGNKEPNRDDYVNSNGSTPPKSENLKNVEAGYRVAGLNFNLGVNGYGMFYKDQLILTGAINDVGESIRQNIPESYRIGLELDGKVLITSSLSWGLTAAFSKNKVKNYQEVFTHYDVNFNFVKTQINNYESSDIAYSPNFVGSSEISFHPLKNAEVALLSKFVSKQYLDNTSNNKRKIDPYFVNDLRLNYQTKIAGIKNVGLTLLVNNLFSELYVSNGYTYSYVYDNRFIAENFYYPQATRNFLLSLNVKF